MDNIFNKISISLIVLGIAFYVFAMTFTALIPSILGLLMQIVLFLGRTFPKLHKLFAHVNVLILVLGIIQLGVPYILYTTAIKHVTALDAIIFPVIEPILNPILVFLILGEALGPWAFLGGLLVLGSVVFRGLLKK